MHDTIFTASSSSATSPASAFDCDVLIAGAGPVGLFLACELRLAGLSVLVLEQAAQAAHARAPLKRLPFGLRGLSSPTIEAFYRRGMLDAVKAGPIDAGAHWRQPRRQAGGHFAGIQFFEDRIDRSQWPYHLDGPADTHLPSEIAHLEDILGQRAQRLGVRILYDKAVQAVEQSDEAVSVHADGELLRARWLVACDGGRSTVRRAAGFSFEGTEPEFTGYSADVVLADPQQLTPGRHYTATGVYTWQGPGVLAMVDFDGGACHRSTPLTRDHVQAVLRRVSGVDVTLTALNLASTWTDRAFQATHYRRGRVLLAGDAAHIHSPLGGQGLNLGLGDAMNLGWKLAATVRGDAPAALLDSYEAERHPVGAQVLDWSRAQVALMRPSRSARALAAILRDLIDTPDGASYFAQRSWGLSLRIDLGAEHPLVGRSAPDLTLADGTRLGALMHDGRGLLLDFSADAPLQAIARRWQPRLKYVACDTHAPFGLRALLVRPDGVVAWVSTGVADQDTLAEAAGRWF